MTGKRLLLGDEAIALGALNAGISGVYAYPGTPSTEITEFIQNHPLTAERGIHCRWCTNEKTAMEAALGMSYAGKRALVCMKHVGMNVCADAFINSAITGVNGGLVVLAADDPSMHSSQNEQTSIFYASFAMVPCLEPSNQQEAYDMMDYAYTLSERLKLPVMVRIVTRLAHSRASVKTGPTKPMNPLHPAVDKNWVLLPGIARRQYDKLIEKHSLQVEASESSPYNIFRKVSGSETAVVACGIAYNYVMEAIENYNLNVDVLKISHYPMPMQKLMSFAKGRKTIIFCEDGYPGAEDVARRVIPWEVRIEGRLTGLLPRTGELNPDNVAQALGVKLPRKAAPSRLVAARPPQLCPGCGHRDVYAALNKVLEDYPNARVFGDIGWYTLGALPPFRTLSSCVDMGASITMAKGAADAGLYPAIAVIGDSTFTHSGMTGLLDCVNANSPITVIISDNLTTAMTGGQDSAGTSKYEAICTSLGVDPAHVRVVVPLPANMPEITRIIREEIEYKGLSVIIPRRECMQTLKRHKK
ncbi:MAG: indolepyruvate ferredoxin oxidoreductase [Bacteroidales bacterium]|nr:indolepyruvate ferredoxin oxidoreductase [Bacteroidales bacterium]